MREIQYSLRKPLVDRERNRQRAKPSVTGSGSWKTVTSHDEQERPSALDTISRSLAEAFKE